MDGIGNVLRGVPGGAPPPRATINVDLSSLSDVLCESCGNATFEEVIKIKKLSKIVSPSGNDELVFMKVLTCYACGSELNVPGIG